MPSVVLDSRNVGEKPTKTTSSKRSSVSSASAVENFDRQLGFYATLTAPYVPPTLDSEEMNASWDLDPVEEEAMQDFCNAMVEDHPRDSSEDTCREVGITEPIVGDPPSSDQRQRLYTPHGKWAEAGLNPIEDWEVLAQLSAGSMCSASLRRGYLGGKPLLYISKLWSLSQINRWGGITSELALYKSSKHMKPLQGIIVPHIINVYTTPGHIDLVMEPPHDCFWIEASPDMPMVLKDRCVEAFAKLHQHGVLHGYVELRHMLIGADCKVTIIDFQRSRSSNPIPEVNLQVATPDEFRMEMRRVMFKLDYKGARANEYAKMRRAAELAEVNKLVLKRCRRSGRPEDFVQPPQEDVVDPAISATLWSDEWIVDCEAAPRRFVVLGRTSQDVQNTIESFLALIREMESLTKRPELFPNVPELVADYPADFLSPRVCDVTADSFLLQHQIHKRKRDMQQTIPEPPTADNEIRQETKRRRLDTPGLLRPVVHATEPLLASSPPHHTHPSYQTPTKLSPPINPRELSPGRKRKRSHSWTSITGCVPEMTFSDFMRLSEMEKEQELARKKRKTSLTSITAEYGSDCERSLSPPTVFPEVDMPHAHLRRVSPCLSPEEAAIRTAMSLSSSSSNAIKAVTKLPPPIIVRDFANKTYDGPKGYYVPHPPTENRMGLERATYIRRRNALNCMELGLNYPSIEDQYGDIVPDINPLPYTMKFEQERDKMTKKRKKTRGLGSLMRKRNMELLSGEERWEIALARNWEEAQDLGNMSKVRFQQPISVVCGIPENPIRYSAPPYSNRGVLKRPKPVKTFQYQQPWEQPSDEELSPKVGPAREALDRSGGFGMLGVEFQYHITTGEETLRKELLNRLRVSDTSRRGVEGIWREEEKRMEEMRRMDSLEGLGAPREPKEILSHHLGEPFRLVRPSAMQEELEEEYLVEKMLIAEDDD